MRDGETRPGRTFPGLLAVACLEALGRMPLALPLAIGGLLLPLYAPFRFRTRDKLRRLNPPVGALAYYRMRLRLALLSVRHDATGPAIRIEGGELFAGAPSFGDASGKAAGRPVLLLGWHQGPVELLHAIPAKAARGRPCFVLTASAFSPALAEWMARKRRRNGVTVVRPGERGALRRWAREGGVLALMIDQVPGEPEAWLPLARHGVKVPWPGRLVDWAVARNPEILAVSARLEKRDRVFFRYDPIAPDRVQGSIGTIMDDALARAPEQYNWSYGKIRAE